MNCKKIQEIILTDYIDDRLGHKQKSLIDQHLGHCHNCNDLLISVKKDILNNFNNVPPFIPDASLWDRIKQTIEEEQTQQIEKSLLPNFWGRLKSAVHIPRPAFALATIVTMIFMTGPTGQLFFSSPVVKINGQDQIEYLSSLIDGPADLANSSNDPQTPIEQYFL